jgi:hypothetical protein
LASLLSGPAYVKGLLAAMPASAAADDARLAA